MIKQYLKQQGRQEDSQASCQRTGLSPTVPYPKLSNIRRRPMKWPLPESSSHSWKTNVFMWTSPELKTEHFQQHSTVLGRSGNA